MQYYLNTLYSVLHDWPKNLEDLCNKFIQNFFSVYILHVIHGIYIINQQETIIFLRKLDGNIV